MLHTNLNMCCFILEKYETVENIVNKKYIKFTLAYICTNKFSIKLPRTNFTVIIKSKLSSISTIHITNRQMELTDYVTKCKVSMCFNRQSNLKLLCNLMLRLHISSSHLHKSFLGADII